MPMEIRGGSADTKEVKVSEIPQRGLLELPDDSGEMNYQEELPDDSGEMNYQEELPDDLGLKQKPIFPNDSGLRASSSIETTSPKTEEAGKKTDLETRQKLADSCAKDYNEKYTPYERAKKKGIDGIEKTKNGGVSFENSSALYKKEDGTKAIVRIEATGKRSADFNRANEAMGFSETPSGYVWHHVDDYDVKTNTFTLQLVKDETHNVTKPHSGGCAQYDSVNGPSYNPPRKDV